MKINEQLEKEIATRLNLTKPICPTDVAEFIADGEQLADALDGYHPERPSHWRAKPAEVMATVLETRRQLDILETLALKVENTSETVKLATIAYQQSVRDYWDKIEREESKPRNAFKVARDEFVSAMEKEIRSLKRKENKESWGTPERQAISDRLELVQYLREEAKYLEYNPETPEFSEQVLWLKVAQAQYKADKFLEFVKTQTTNA